MKIFKILSGLTWFYFIYICVVNYYDYRKDQLPWENLTRTIDRLGYRGLSGIQKAK